MVLVLGKEVQGVAEDLLEFALKKPGVKQAEAYASSVSTYVFRIAFNSKINSIGL